MRQHRPRYIKEKNRPINKKRERREEKNKKR